MPEEMTELHLACSASQHERRTRWHNTHSSVFLGLMSVFSDTKMPSRNLRSSLRPTLHTYLTWEQQRERAWLSIPSKTSSPLTSAAGVVETLVPPFMKMTLSYLPPKKFLMVMLDPSLGITTLMGKWACTNLILYLKPYDTHTPISI